MASKSTKRPTTGLNKNEVEELTKIYEEKIEKLSKDLKKLWIY